MRPDMAKVVTEKPRRGSGWRNRKSRARVDVDVLNSEGSHEDGKGADGDYGPRKMKMAMGATRGQSGDGRESKDFSDLLGPLQKYLRKQVGRPWDKVYSELRAHLDFRSVSGLHIWDHVKREVEIKTVAYGKEVWSQHGGYHMQAQGLYVHPLTGILRWAEGSVPGTRYYPPPWARALLDAPPKPPAPIVLDDTTSLINLQGIWYRATYGKSEVYVPPHIYRGAVIKSGFFKDEVILQAKKQLNRAELKAHGLKNDRAA